MSTSWDLQCIDHRNWASFDWNHGDEAIATVWRHRERLIELWDLAREEPTFDIGEIKLQLNYEELKFEQVDFFRLHGDHRLELVDEYGNRKTVDTMEPLAPHHCATCSCPPK